MYPNIDPTSVEAQYESVLTPRARTVFNEKNYLNVRLQPGEKTKTLTIRLLPFSREEPVPFHMIHTHNIKVSPELNESQFKNYVCLRKTQDIDPKYGNLCPICEANMDANRVINEMKQRGSQDKEAEKMWKEISYATRGIDTWIVRCIERGKEEEGVKFWKFNNSKKKDGVYDKIMALYMVRKNERPGYNIFDLQNGKDLKITLTQEYNEKTRRTFTAVNVVDAGFESALSNDPAQIDAWIDDPKKWTDVYGVKNYDYLKLAYNQEVPFYDKDLGKWVSKKEYYETHPFNPTFSGATSEQFAKTFQEQNEQFGNFSSDQVDDIPNGYDQQYMEQPNMGW